MRPSTSRSAPASATAIGDGVPRRVRQPARGIGESHNRTYRPHTVAVLPIFLANPHHATVPVWHAYGLRRDVPLRTRLARIVLGLLIVFTALVSVGLTAPADAPFAIGVRAMFLGLDIDIKVGASHLHYHWSAIPLSGATTKTPVTLL